MNKRTLDSLQLIVSTIVYIHSVMIYLTLLFILRTTANIAQAYLALNHLPDFVGSLQLSIEQEIGKAN